MCLNFPAMQYRRTSCAADDARHAACGQHAVGGPDPRVRARSPGSAAVLRCAAVAAWTPDNSLAADGALCAPRREHLTLTAHRKEPSRADAVPRHLLRCAGYRTGRTAKPAAIPGIGRCVPVPATCPGLPVRDLALAGPTLVPTDVGAMGRRRPDRTPRSRYRPDDPAAHTVTGGRGAQPALRGSAAARFATDRCGAEDLGRVLDRGRRLHRGPDGSGRPLYGRGDQRPPAGAGTSATH